MLKSSIIFLFVTIVSFQSSYAIGEISIPFELVNGLIVVEAEINGTKDNFIVDSGSNGILLNGQSEQSDVSYATLSGTIDGTERAIDKLKVGEFELGNLMGFSTDLSNLEVYLDRSIGGILSCAVFTPHSLVFDFKSSQLIISDENIKLNDIEGLSFLAFEVIEELPITHIDIDGKRFSFVLDTGASSHFVDIKFLNNSALNTSPTGMSKDIITAGGQSVISAEYVISGDENESNFWNNTNAFEKDFSVLSNELEIEISGIISLSKLTEDKVLFDVKDMKLYY